jgi:hypothetical protein
MFIIPGSLNLVYFYYVYISLIRFDAAAASKHVFLRDLVRLFDHLGTRLSVQNQTALVSMFGVKDEAERNAAIAVWNQLTYFLFCVLFLCL